MTPHHAYIYIHCITEDNRLRGAYYSEKNNVKKIEYSRAKAFLFPFFLPFVTSSVFFFSWSLHVRLAASKRFTRTATRARTQPAKSWGCRQVNQNMKAGDDQTGKRAEGSCVKHYAPSACRSQINSARSSILLACLRKQNKTGPVS